MKSICNPFGRKPSIENSGDNYGVQTISNSGLIVVNQGMGYDNTKALCLDIVTDALNKYKAEACEEAMRRDIKISTGQILDEQGFINGLCSEFSVNARFHDKTVHILRSSEPEAEAELPPLAARSVLDRLA